MKKLPVTTAQWIVDKAVERRNATNAETVFTWGGQPISIDKAEDTLRRSRAQGTLLDEMGEGIHSTNRYPLLTSAI